MTIQLSVFGMRLSREPGRNLMRVAFREHLRGAQVMISVISGVGLIVLGLLLLASR